MSGQKVLLVDDDPQMLKMMQHQLSNYFEVHVAVSGQEALDIVAREGPFAVLVSDMVMPNMSGLELLEQMQILAPATTRMVLTGHANQKTAIDAVNKGHVFRFYTKPCPADILVQGVEEAAEQYEVLTSARAENATEDEEREKVLIVEHDQALRDELWGVLFSSGISKKWDFSFSVGGEDAVAALREGDFSVVISNLDNPYMDGKTFMEKVSREVPSVVRVILSESSRLARMHGLADDDRFYLPRGSSVVELASVIRDACDLHKWLQEHPRPLSLEDIQVALVEFFSKGILRKKFTLDEIPEVLQPYISRHLRGFMQQEGIDVTECFPDEFDVNDGEFL